MRRGFLGAFPGDGLTHPLLLRLAHELVAAAPRIFADYALALWWLFKYSETNPAGIGIHADPAAVNCNLWLTQDAACLDGGGLTVYSHVPELHTHTLAVNHEFADGEEAVTCNAFRIFIVIQPACFSMIWVLRSNRHCVSNLRRPAPCTASRIAAIAPPFLSRIRCA